MYVFTSVFRCVVVGRVNGEPDCYTEHPRHQRVIRITPYISKSWLPPLLLRSELMTTRAVVFYDVQKGVQAITQSYQLPYILNTTFGRRCLCCALRPFRLLYCARCASRAEAGRSSHTDRKGVDVEVQFPRTTAS